jgi:transcriptional regulator with XRE-family HTH domain
MTFGEKLKELRSEKNWKQETIAKEIGADNRQISLYENNKITPSIETIIKFAQAYNVSIDYLLIEDYPRRPLYFKDNSIIDKLQIMDMLTDKEKDSILNIMQGLAFKNKIQNALDVVKSTPA